MGAPGSKSQRPATTAIVGRAGIAAQAPCGGCAFWHIASCRRRFRSRPDGSSITCGRLGAAIPLPKRVSPPVTEVGLSGPTKLLISRENERAWRVSLRGGPSGGGPSEGRTGHQRDQCESSDKCLHHISPLSITVCDFPATQDRRLVLCIPKDIGLVFPKEIGSAYSQGR